MVSYPKEVRELLENIEVPDSEYEKAVSRYESLTAFIGNSDLNEMWVHSPPLGAQANFNRIEKHDTM